MTKTEKAFELLNELVDKGVEFPDAQDQASNKFNLNAKQTTELATLYDEQSVFVDYE